MKTGIGLIDKVVIKVFCSHPSWEFVRNIYGDEINLKNARSIYKCTICGKIKYCPEQKITISEVEGHKIKEPPEGGLYY